MDSAIVTKWLDFFYSLNDNFYTMKLNDETAAKKVYDAAIKRFNRAHELWFGDVNMLTLHTKDYLDIIKIANLINNGDTIKAMKQIYNLDTEVRDEIPQDVWDYCDKI